MERRNSFRSNLWHNYICQLHDRTNSRSHSHNVFYTRFHRIQTDIPFRIWHLEHQSYNKTMSLWKENEIYKAWMRSLAQLFSFICTYDYEEKRNCRYLLCELNIFSVSTKIPQHEITRNRQLLKMGMAFLTHLTSLQTFRLILAQAQYKESERKVRHILLFPVFIQAF